MTSKEAKKTPKSKEKELKKELKEAKKKAQEYLDGWRRAKADYINLKKRTEQQIKEITDFSNTVLILEILPVLDSFNQAFKHLKKMEKDDKWVEGIGQVKKQLEEVLKSEGLEKIDTVGCKFDPQLHEAVACEKNSKFEDEIITEEIEVGYKLKDKVIRPAGVKVCKK